jgi:two-component system, chemotaxis family, sensor kinase CheA
MSELELDADLVEVVLAEAQESLESALWTLRAINHGAQSPEVVASLFRCFHSIKGNTAMAGKTQVSRASHRVENVLDVVRSQARPLTEAEAKALIDVVDLLHPLIDGEDSPQVWESLERSLLHLEQLFLRLSRAPSQHIENEHDSVPPPSGSDSIDSTPRTESQDHEANDASPERTPEANHAKIKVDAQSLLDAMTVAGELFQLDERLKYFVAALSAQVRNEEADMWDGLTQISREFDSSIERLYDQLIHIQRLPVSQLTGPLERSVRDICRKTGKEIDFVVQGRDLRIDKNVIQALKDPLMHMVRNASDHGAEMPDERRAAGKPTSVRIVLAFEDTDDDIVVTLSDDGRGMDVARVLRKAIENGLVSELAARQLTTSQVIQFIFRPGFSTADRVSELSGRGVGMDVVKKAIADAGGAIDTKTELGKGTTFRISIPKLGSPVVDGLAVRSGAVVYLLPVKNVLCFMARTDLTLVTEPHGQVSALYQEHLYPLFHLPGEPDARRLKNGHTTGALVEDRAGRRGIVIVDEVLGRRRALSQQVAYEACHVERRSSVAILGDGTMGFSISIEDLLSEKLLLNGRGAGAFDGHEV